MPRLQTAEGGRCRLGARKPRVCRLRCRVRELHSPEAQFAGLSASWYHSRSRPSWLSLKRTASKFPAPLPPGSPWPVAKYLLRLQPIGTTNQCTASPSTLREKTKLKATARVCRCRINYYCGAEQVPEPDSRNYRGFWWHGAQQHLLPPQSVSHATLMRNVLLQGFIAIEMAKAWGAKHILTSTSGDAGFAFVRSLGATWVSDYVRQRRALSESAGIHRKSLQRLLFCACVAVSETRRHV